MSTLPQTSQAQAAPQHEYLTGVVERLTFHSEESGYTVARFKTSQSRDLITIVGSFANIQAGQTLQLTGLWREHPQYGAQFQVTHCKETKPATITGIEKYLGSGLIKGVGPVTAKRIVVHFGLETLDIIENHIERLIEVPRIAKKRIKMIQSAWSTQKAIKEVMLFLQSHGVSTTYAVKIYKHYGDVAIATVTNNPYQLATDIYGIGFITADAIARNLGIAPDSEYRYRAGIVHVLGEAAEDGHCFLPQSELVEQTVKRLSIKDHQPNSQAIAQLLVQMGMEDVLIMQGHPEHQFVYYQPSFYYSEQNLAAQLHHLLARPVTVDLPRVLNWIERFTQAKGIELSSQQQQAVEMAASQRVLILTGGPGTGKTFCTRTIVALWKAMGKFIVLASPTGRAAQRLSEVARMEAKTIHRLLEFDPRTMKFKRDADNPIEARAIVVDEASMLDLFLAHSLLKAIPLDAQLLLVGDIDQLPSVGPGNVLRDLIASGQIPVVRLTQVFRQAAQSYIVSNAHRINSGQYPLLESVSLTPRSDCLWLGAPEPQCGVQGIQELVSDVIPKLGFDPARDVQVLCPMTRGEVGTRHLNGVLQALINPPSAGKAEIKSGGIVLRVGDRVIQQVNDYDREVFNGDLGTIAAIDLEETEVTVQYQERLVTYDYADLNEITLAFATTIHKSQGSEYRVVILPLYMQHYMMLSRHLIYTGLTRAKQLAILVGPSKAIGLAVRQVKDTQRYTLLQERLVKREHQGSNLSNLVHESISD
ncbi:MAG: ATP-dependent RecD-like DNA helicase [Chroococcidiopsis cubana SAG 39.79]|uniref:SF1B family DNA helicase RecD2 n=3 Tax=Chroococcidiopsis cubana TaxID=171392 RepID=UPI002AC39768|nr:ATP-dependent RecD-like DNA helicase [Chroococcidiopsis cubana]MDZ4877385.1 ATP-dependent RecD-like DNA helicase [Chroococcidiopsis cubana SAG 39.79]